MSSPVKSLTIRIHLPPSPTDPRASNLALDTSTASRVSDLKRSLVERGGLAVEEGEALALAKGARRLRDGECVGEVFDDEERKGHPSTPLTLHVIARPSILDKLRRVATPVEPELPAPSETPAVPAAKEAASADLSAAAGLSIQTTSAVEAAATPAGPVNDDVGITVPAAELTGYSPAYVVPPEPVASTSALPASAAAPSPSPSASASSVPISPYTTYISHLQRLLPLQRALLLLNLQKAHAHYTRLLTGPRTDANEGDGVEEVERMLKEVGVWRIVEDKVAQSEAEWRKMYGDGDGGEDEGVLVDEEFQIVQVGGFPYLLHTPPDPNRRPSRPPLAAILAHTRAETVQHCLTTMLQLLLTMSPGVPALAYGRATAARSGAQPAAANPNAGDALAAARLAQLGLLNAPAGALGRPMHPLAQGAQVRRRATLSVIINLDVILSFLIPLFLLSLKLAFLLWIFGRHASPTKRVILGALAALWVIWEGVGIRRRRLQRERDRERVERERRRAVRAAARAHQQQQQQQQQQQHQAPQDDVQPDAGTLPRPPAAQPAPAPAAVVRRARHPAATDRPHRRRDPPSRLSPKYWINLIAAVGLVSEARELGLSPRFIAGRPIAPAPPPPRTAAEKRYEALKRVVRNVGVAVVLFAGTLSPEVERKRKRALEKRERLLAERRVAAAAAAARAFLDQPPVLSPPSGASDPLAAADDGLRRRPTGAQGRSAVSDEQLFQDGGSDAYQSRQGFPPASANATSGHIPSASTSARALGSPTTPTAATSSAPAPAPPHDSPASPRPDVPHAPRNILADSDGGGEDGAEDDDVASATSGDGATTSDDEERARGDDAGDELAGEGGADVDQVVALF